MLSKDEKAISSAFDELVKARSEQAIRHAFDGYGISWEDGIRIVGADEKDLTEEELKKRIPLEAAVRNLVDFSAAQQYQLITRLPSIEEFMEEHEDEEFDADELFEMWLAVCQKYNRRYAGVENRDIEYAMTVAAALEAFSAQEMLTYMTMGDERVRPWHLAHEGFTAPKQTFPAWLIPPIEHGCRCFLVSGVSGAGIGLADVQASKTPRIPDWFDRTFKESVALGGRIFSDEHSYFKINKKHVAGLRRCADRVREALVHAKD